MSNEPLPRREFGRLLAAGMAGLATGAAANADDPAPPAGDAAPPFGPPPPHVLFVELVRQLYPDDRLTVEILESIERDVRGQLFRGKMLANHPFENSDEPATIFAAYRADG